MLDVNLSHCSNDEGVNVFYCLRIILHPTNEANRHHNLQFIRAGLKEISNRSSIKDIIFFVFFHGLCSLICSVWMSVSFNTWLTWYCPSERTINLLLCLLAFVVGASPRVPPGLAFSEGQVWEEGSQGSFYLVWLTTQSVLSGAVVRTLSVETHVVGWEEDKNTHLLLAAMLNRSLQQLKGGCIFYYSSPFWNAHHIYLKNNFHKI